MVYNWNDAEIRTLCRKENVWFFFKTSHLKTLNKNKFLDISKYYNGIIKFDVGNCILPICHIPHLKPTEPILKQKNYW